MNCCILCIVTLSSAHDDDVVVFPLFFSQTRTLSGAHVLCKHRLRFGSGHQHQRQRAAEHVQRRGNGFPHRQQRVRSLSPSCTDCSSFPFSFFLLQKSTQIFGRNTSANTQNEKEKKKKKLLLNILQLLFQSRS